MVAAQHLEDGVAFGRRQIGEDIGMCVMRDRL